MCLLALSSYFEGAARQGRAGAHVPQCLPALSSYFEGAARQGRAGAHVPHVPACPELIL